MNFTEYIFHVGNVSELHFITRGGLILGGKSLIRDRQSVFFTAVDPMDDDQSMEEDQYDVDPNAPEIPCDLSKPRIVPYKQTWRPHLNTVYGCNLKLAQEQGLQFYQRRSHAISLFNTLPPICLEKAVCMTTKDELYHKACFTPRIQRVLLKPNSSGSPQCGQPNSRQTQKHSQRVVT